jgi:hypothetical protein
MDYERSAGGVLMPVAAMVAGGTFTIEHVRNGEVIDVFDSPNLVVDQGLNHMLDVLLHGSTQVGTWYLGLFEGNYTPVAGLLASTIAGAATECTAYDETTRQIYNEAAAASKVTTNSANKATFTMNATKSVYGAFIISDSTKGGTSGTLLAASKFAAAKSVVATDQLLLTYTFTASSS